MMYASCYFAGRTALLYWCRRRQHVSRDASSLRRSTTSATVSSGGKSRGRLRLSKLHGRLFKCSRVAMQISRFLFQGCCSAASQSPPRIDMDKRCSETSSMQHGLLVKSRPLQITQPSPIL
mmetsp:Transcript_148525/g.370119  ORF Transcript_148525/g.370119 Transcript_148525/m.370119 type:complete len:121 (-) Transcript_148525:222-584(-)